MQVSREEVKQLALNVGLREAARQTGINENTMLSWSKRGKWFVTPDKPKTVHQKEHTAITAIKPSDALQNTLLQRRDKSKLHLSEYVEKASYRASQTQEEALLEVSQDVKNVAAIHSTLWPEKESEDKGILGGLQVFSNQTVIQVNPSVPYGGHHKAE